MAGAAVAGLSAAGSSSRVFDRLAPSADRVSADASGVAVIDGETLRLGDQVVRLHGVQAPARGSPCGGGQDCGGQAASALAGLVRDHRVNCRLLGRDRQGRPLASCEVNGMDLGRTIVASGWARADAGAADLADLEAQARRQRRGLWALAGD